MFAESQLLCLPLPVYQEWLMLTDHLALSFLQHSDPSTLWNLLSLNSLRSPTTLPSSLWPLTPGHLFCAQVKTQFLFWVKGFLNGPEVQKFLCKTVYLFKPKLQVSPWALLNFEIKKCDCSYTIFFKQMLLLQSPVVFLYTLSVTEQQFPELHILHE